MTITEFKQKYLNNPKFILNNKNKTISKILQREKTSFSILSSNQLKEETKLIKNQIEINTRTSNGCGIQMLNKKRLTEKGPFIQKLEKIYPDKKFTKFDIESLKHKTLGSIFYEVKKKSISSFLIESIPDIQLTYKTKNVLIKLQSKKKEELMSISAELSKLFTYFIISESSEGLYIGGELEKSFFLSIVLIFEKFSKAIEEKLNVKIQSYAFLDDCFHDITPPKWSIKQSQYKSLGLKEIIAECNKRVKELGELRVSFKQQFK
jgi:hypothetical protein